MLEERRTDAAAPPHGERSVDMDRLLAAALAIGGARDRADLAARASDALRDVLDCEQAGLLDEAGHGDAPTGPLKSALVGRAARAGNAIAISAGELLDVADDAPPVETWAVAPLPGHPRLALCAGWRARHEPRHRELRALSIVAQWCAASHDLLDRRAAVDASHRASDDFVNAAAHELRTPLTPLRLTIDRAARALAVRGDSERAKGALAHVDEHVRRITHLVDTLLEATRVARGDLVLVRRDTDLGALVREVVDRFAEPARLSGCALTLVAPERVVARCDAQRLREAVAQLVGNAVKFGCGCPVAVELARTGRGARLEVRDGGGGIAAADQERIFGRFERATRARNYGGLGVGLWLAREIARAHGGEVTVESPPGGGAVFRLEVPIATARTAR